MAYSTEYVIERQSRDEAVVWSDFGRKLHRQFFGPHCLAEARVAFPGAEEDPSWDPDQIDYGPSEMECVRSERQQMGICG